MIMNTSPPLFPPHQLQSRGGCKASFINGLWRQQSNNLEKTWVLSVGSWGRNFSLPFKFLSAGLVMQFTRGSLIRENNQISFHTYTWKPYIQRESEEAQRRKGKRSVCQSELRVTSRLQRGGRLFAGRCLPCHIDGSKKVFPDNFSLWARPLV